MVSMRKALFIATWGLSGLVLKDDSKQQNIAKATNKRARPKKQTKVASRQRTARRPTSPTARRPAPQAARRPTAQATRRPAAQATASAAQAAGHSKPAAPQATRPAAVAQESGSATGTTNELERLAILHGRGVLTDEEFSRAKAGILGTGPAPREASGASGAFPAIAANVAAARHLTGSPVRDRGTPMATEMGA